MGPPNKFNDQTAQELVDSMTPYHRVRALNMLESGSWLNLFAYMRKEPEHFHAAELATVGWDPEAAWDQTPPGFWTEVREALSYWWETTAPD